MPLPNFRNDKRRENLKTRIARRKGKVSWNRYMWFFYCRDGKCGLGVHEIDTKNMFKSKKKE